MLWCVFQAAQQRRSVRLVTLTRPAPQHTAPAQRQGVLRGACTRRIARRQCCKMTRRRLTRVKPGATRAGMKCDVCPQTGSGRHRTGPVAGQEMLAANCENICTPVRRRQLVRLASSIAPIATFKSVDSCVPFSVRATSGRSGNKNPACSERKCCCL